MTAKKETEFSIFADALANFFQGEMSPEEFTKALFSSIYGGSKNEEDTTIDDVDPRSYRAYFYGQNNITKLAKKVVKDIDLGSFAEFIKMDAGDSLTSLSDVFSQWCPDISEATYGIEIAERFQTIIENAARGKRKKKQSTSVNDTEEDKAAVIEKTPKEKYGVALVAEVMSTCPCDGCSRPLFSKTAGKIESNYEVVVIDDSIPGLFENNLIAMCPEHAKEYNENRTKQRTSHMRSIKEKYRELSDIQDITAEENLDEDIIRCLSKIPKLPYPMNVDLNYEPVPLTQKIEEDNNELLARIKVWVNMHYPDVHEALRTLDKNGKQKFEPFCKQVRANYLRLKKEEYPQNEIYDGMIEWLVKATNEDRHTCEVIIAYFVQKCEVFDVIAE